MGKKRPVEEYMYRYLEKYQGKYRVMSEYDLQTLDWPRNEKGKIDESFEDLYIPCKKGVIKHCYDDYDLLVLCFYDKNESVAGGIYKELKEKFKDIYLKYEKDNRDQFIYFYGKDLDTIAKVIKPRTSGKSIKWKAKSNMKLFKPKKGKKTSKKS